MVCFRTGLFAASFDAAAVPVPLEADATEADPASTESAVADEILDALSAGVAIAGTDASIEALSVEAAETEAFTSKAVADVSNPVFPPLLSTAESPLPLAWKSSAPSCLASTGSSLPAVSAAVSVTASSALFTAFFVLRLRLVVDFVTDLISFGSGCPSTGSSSDEVCFAGCFLTKDLLSGLFCSGLF